MEPALEFRLLNEYQRAFPLVQRPFAVLGRALGAGEAEVIAALGQLCRQGEVSRIGAVFAPGSLGVGTLAAMAVPSARLEAVAAQVNRRRAVNHNYEREHRLNLWFVATAATREALDAELQAIARETGILPIALPLLEEYHIDLGFDLADGARAPGRGPARGAPIRAPRDLRLAAALQEGLDLTSRPYAALAARAGIDEDECIERLRDWQDAGTVRRIGVIVRHRELGYVANAMAVWDVPDDEVTALGRRLAACAGINLCYRRARHLPQWRYNLFCMVHGKRREDVQARLAQVAAAAGLAQRSHAILFSRRRFKQTGARYLDAPGAQAGAAHG